MHELSLALSLLNVHGICSCNHCMIYGLSHTVSYFLCRRLMSLKSSDEFYSAMEEISRQMQEGTAFESNELLEVFGLSHFVLVVFRSYIYCRI